MNSGNDIVEQLDTLVKSWGGTRPSWDEYFICTAILISSRSAWGRPPRGGGGFIGGGGPPPLF